MERRLKPTIEAQKRSDDKQFAVFVLVAIGVIIASIVLIIILSIEKPKKNHITVAFDAGLGACKTDFEDSVTIKKNSLYNLPSSSNFIAPVGCEFDYFEAVGASEHYHANQTILNIGSEDVTFKAYYKQKIEVIEENNRHYIEFGRYPQTFVGHAQNLFMEEWFAEEGPTETGVYAVGDVQHYAYTYLQADYVRVENRRYEDGYAFSNYEAIGENGVFYWFEVQPVRWLILNYNTLPVNGGSDAHINLICDQVLTAGIPFYENNDDSQKILWQESSIRQWLHDVFLTDAFSNDEQQSLLPNEDLENDKLFLLSFIEIDSLYSHAFADILVTNDGKKSRPTDFALANLAYQSFDYTYYWLRTARDADNMCCIYPGGGYAFEVPHTLHLGVRPAITLSLADLA